MNPFDMFKKAQELQQSLAQMQQRLSALRVIGQAGGGMAKATMNGKFELVAMELAPEVFEPGPDGKPDVGLIQDLVVMACRAAMAHAQEAAAKEMGSMPGLADLGGLAGMPGMSGMPGPDPSGPSA